MTALNIASDIPNSITTVEMIHAWSGLALRTMYPTLEAVEGVGINERVAQAGVFYVASDNRYRLLVRSSILVTPDHLIGGQKMWTYAQEFGTTPLPAGFKS